MLDKALVSLVCFTVIIILFVGMIGMILTIVQKTEFNIMCRSALYEMDLAGGLTAISSQKLFDTLTQSGYKNILISGSEQVQYGDWMSLEVCGYVKSYKFVNLFQKEEEMLYFSYNRKIISRKIHNFAY